jgi:hypothetical protein
MENRIKERVWPKDTKTASLDSFDTPQHMASPRGIVLRRYNEY